MSNDDPSKKDDPAGGGKPAPQPRPARTTQKGMGVALPAKPPTPPVRKP